MKVTTDTPELLIVESRPVFLAIGLVVFILLFVGIGFAVMAAGEWWGIVFPVFGGGLGLVGLWAFVRRVQVVFHRPDAYVELRRRNLFGASRVRYGLAEIDHAEIEESHSSESGTTYRVVLVIERGQSTGRHPLTLAYSSGAGHQIAADTINRWLEAAR